ncbi:MAG: hypothetical protein U5L96_03065 [Owenweeksia sp.]|nr:hypothetical protein [Owenweeksia sp.]
MWPWIPLPSPTPDTYQEVIIPITTANGYNGTHEHVVLAHNMAATFDYIRVDEFVYEDIPPCPKVTGLSISTTTTDSAYFTFDDGGGTSFDYGAGAPQALLRVLVPSAVFQAARLV